MKDLGKQILAIALTLAPVSTGFAMSSLSTMTVGEVSELLAQAGPTAESSSVSAKDTEREYSEMVLLPVPVTAEDMMTKLYGVVDPGVSKDECVRQSRERLRLTPQEDSGALWLESATGYGVNYYGMFPDVSAMVRYGDDNGGVSVSDYGYFFLFPYTQSSRQDAIRDQADFCGSLLQEMADMGLAMDLNTASDDLFEAVGDYNGNFVDIRLLDEKGVANGGRYILILSIEPGAFTPVDNIMADSPTVIGNGAEIIPVEELTADFAE